MSNSVSATNLRPAASVIPASQSAPKAPTATAKSPKTYKVVKGGSTPAAGPITSTATAREVAAAKASCSAPPTVGNLIDSIKKLENASKSKGLSAAERTELQQLSTAKRAELKQLAEGNLATAKKNCEQKGWSPAAQTRYLDDVKAAETAYKFLDPKGARLKELQTEDKRVSESVKKLTDGGKEKLQEVDKAVEVARKEGDKNKWNQASQLKYLDAIQTAIGRYKNINPNDPQLAPLRKERDRVQGDIRTAVDAKVSDAAKKCTEAGSTVPALKKYQDVVQEARKTYEASGQGGTAPAKELEKLDKQLDDQIKGGKNVNKAISAADAGVEKARENYRKQGGDTKSERAYLSEVRDAIRTYEKYAPTDSRLAELRKLETDLANHINQGKQFRAA